MITNVKRAKVSTRTKRAARDDLENYIAQRSARNPEFPALMAAAAERKRLLRELATARRVAGLTQTDVAARMGTSASAVARLERGEMNPTVATLQRFVAAIGKTLDWRLVEKA